MFKTFTFVSKSEIGHKLLRGRPTEYGVRSPRKNFVENVKKKADPDYVNSIQLCTSSFGERLHFPNFRTQLVKVGNVDFSYFEINPNLCVWH